MSKSFGLVQPSLIQQIKKILDQYHDDGQILKELIQNAEDAGAKEVKFLYDKHSHETKKLCNTRLAKFQGPALYAYNDATFTNDDWNGIGMLCDSIKEKDPTKVGRFGLGFKSVFHMTDLPSVISGDSVGIIDPEEKYFSSKRKRSGQKWHLRQDQKDIRKNSDQFAPYEGIFGCDDETFERGSYEGTLFRLPLRQEASKLSDTIYSQKKMEGLLECFAKDAHLILLFLMVLEQIEVYERQEDRLKPRRLFHVGIRADCLEEVRKAREDFSAKVKQNASALSSGSFPEVKKTYPLTIEKVHYNNGGAMKSEHSYVVTLFFSGSDVSGEIKSLMTNESLSYLPLVGVALPLQPQIKARREKGGVIDVEDDDDDDDCKLVASRASGSGIKRKKQSSGNERKKMKTNAHEPQGHLFCFLPLPLESKSLTGLPVHVNGFFALSQNRRHLKWPSADQDETLTDKSLLWNKGLLQEVLPKAYAELILHVISCSSRDEQRQMMTTSDVYSAWPDINNVDVKWKSIVQPLFDILLKRKILHTDAHGGGWCRVEDSMLDDLKKSDVSRKIVIDLLTKTGINIVTAPAHVKTALQKHCTCELQYVTPKIMRSRLKADPSCYAHLNHQDKILLLKFVLSDSNFQDLHGLELLPLADGTFTTFGGRWDASIYIDSTEHPKSLLPGLQRMFLDTEVDDAVTEQLKNAVRTGHTQLQHFDKEAVKRHLHKTLPSHWRGSDDHVTWYPGSSTQLTDKWLKALWEYFAIHFAQTAFDLDAFVGLPLVPLTPMSNQSEVQLARIQRPSSLVLASFNGEKIDESVCHVLKILGLTIMEDPPEYIRHYPELVPYVNLASARGVLNAIRVFIKNPDNKEKLIKKSMELKRHDIYQFREFLASVSQVDSDMKDILRKLPLFERWAGGSQKQDSRFVSLDEVKNAAPTDDRLPSVNVFIDLIDLKRRDSHRLASLLGISPMSKGKLLAIMLEDALQGKYCSEDLDKIVKFIFQRFSMFSEEDTTCLSEKMKQLPFVALDSKSPRKMPRELFDPEVKILNKIFLDENVFPEHKYYAQPEVLIQLRKLGLKREDGITASDIFKCAKLVSLKKNTDKAKIRSFAILKLLEKNLSLLEKKVQRVPLKDCLCSVPWIPFLRKRPEAYHADFPLKQPKKECFVCPKDVTSHEFVNLVGSIKYLVDTRDFPKVSEKFGWDKQPSLQDVKSHLENVIDVFQKSKSMDDLETKMAFGKIYFYFQQSLKNAEDEVKEVLSPLKFILVRKQLLSAKQVAFSCQVSYPPYLCQLPDEYKLRFRQLFQALGVREIFEVSDYIKTLEALEHKYGKKRIAKELKQVTLDVVRLLARAMEKENVTADEAVKTYGIIFIPDSKGIMRPSTEVCVKDVNDYCTWIDDEGVTYANEDIPIHICITLGVKTRRQETLRRHTIGLPFGQKEKLTNRLKRILTGYPCGQSIMKELLQNADDAKATKVCFIKDPRQHRGRRVFEECWKSLQGPALCVYNNAPFTESDIQGIQNLGEGNKGDDPNKTGQYGVGFNAVYHLTDAPTFISQGEEIGEVMCVFDPNLKFAPGADESRPGVMYKDLPALRRKFPDVFPCYDHGRWFPLKDATMFRFPLRNEDMATTSKISNDAMTIQKLDNLLKDFKEELLQVLLYNTIPCHAWWALTDK